MGVTDVIVTVFYNVWMICFWQITITMLLWQILLPMWQMLLPLVDWCLFGWCYCQSVGWCYCQPFMADVIAMCGWCCCHNWLLLYWLMLLPMWWLMFLPYVADGIATLYVMGWCYCPVADSLHKTGVWRRECFEVAIMGKGRKEDGQLQKP